MQRTITAVVGALLSLNAIARPPEPPADMRAAPGQVGWSVDERTGCWVWNADPKPNETVHWSAGCAPDGPATGTGTVEWREGGNMSRRYEGDLLDGKQHGHGVWTWADGARYEGEFRDGKRHGRGIQTWASGARYEGEYLDGKEHGRGAYQSADGDRYEGEFRDGKRHGRGLYAGANGGRYEREYLDGKRHGRGAFTWAGGDRYEGRVREGKPHGHGLSILANGDRYEGEHRDGWPHGFGTAWLQGYVHAGNWAGGCLRDGSRRAAFGRPLSECP